MTSEIGDDAVQAWIAAVREEQTRTDTPTTWYPTPAELVEALAYGCATAKRQPYVIGTAEYPSRWDKAHAHIDWLLDQLVGR